MTLGNTGLALIIALVLVVLFLCACCIILLVRELNYEENDYISKADQEEASEGYYSDDEEEPSKTKTQDAPSIVLQKTESTIEEGMEASLSSSSSADNGDIEAPRVAMHNVNFVQTTTTSRSYVSSKLSHDSSVSQPGKAIDVHACNSGCCELCRQRNQGVQFISAQPLEPKMVGKLQTGPPRWWEFGISFVDLYQHANGISGAETNHRQRRDDGQSSIWGIFSGSKSSRKKRSLKYVSSDGDESV